MPQCHVCVKNKGTTVWKNCYMERLLTCDKCEPPEASCEYVKFHKDPYGMDGLKYHGCVEYAWAMTGVQDPIADSFLCFDCHTMAKANDKGVLEHMAIWMYGNVKLPKYFRFKKYEGRAREFIVCNECGVKRHAEGRDGRGTVTEDVAKYIVRNELPIE
jgi:hypothetical protein